MGGFLKGALTGLVSFAAGLGVLAVALPPDPVADLVPLSVTPAVPSGGPAAAPGSGSPRSLALSDAIPDRRAQAGLHGVTAEAPVPVSPGQVHASDAPATGQEVAPSDPSGPATEGLPVAGPDPTGSEPADPVAPAGGPTGPDTALAETQPQQVQPPGVERTLTARADPPQSAAGALMAPDPGQGSDPVTSPAPVPPASAADGHPRPGAEGDAASLPAGRQTGESDADGPDAARTEADGPVTDESVVAVPGTAGTEARGTETAVPATGVPEADIPTTEVAVADGPVTETDGAGRAEPLAPAPVGAAAEPDGLATTPPVPADQAGPSTVPPDPSGAVPSRNASASEAAAAVITLPAPERLPPAASGRLTPGSSVQGVRLGRLPQVSTSEPGALLDPAADAASAATAPDAGHPLPDPDGVPRWQRHAVAVAASDLPRVGLVLLDITRDRDAEAALLDLPFPVTVGLDPFDPDALRRALIYRAAGHEVVLALDGVSPLSTASDIEVLFAAWLVDFPEMLGVVDVPPGDGRRARALAQSLVPLLRDTGLALIAPDRGLSPLLNAARAGGVAQAGLYRSLDPADETADAVRRFLDRAAFEAERQGSIAVIGRADRAATRDGIAGWLAGSRAARVQATPVGAVLAVQVAD